MVLSISGTLVLLLGLLVFFPAQTHAAPLSLTVSGNHLLDGSGNVVHLHGVNRSGTEYACIQGNGIFDGPSDLASVQAIRSWGANYVRVPLNEDCWLGINGVNPAYAGANYINAITNYVALLNSQGLYAEVSLIWAAPGTYPATYQPGAPDEDHSPAMWSSLAQTFKGNTGVILAPWGETIVDANCFLNGGVCEATYGPSNTAYPTAGMQQAVTVMRQAGYTGPIAIPGIDYANDLTQWLSHEPTDPAHQLVAEAHVYGNNTCGAQNGGACLVSTLNPVAAVVPLVLGETGETYDGSECGSGNMQTILTWADSVGVGWAAWTWDTWGDCTTLALIANYNGTVESGSGYASYIHTHLLSYGTAPAPTSTAVPPQPTTNPSPPPAPAGHEVLMGFAIGWQMPTNPPWGDLTQEDLFALQTTNGTALDTSFLANVNVPAWTAAAHAHGVQALITIGGIADQNWQYACTGSNQAGFIQNLVHYMVQNGFDGIDLDIEDDVWSAQTPTSPQMTACIEAISSAAKAVKTQAGNVPLISEDVTTPWMGTDAAPSQAAVDQFNLMTYGDTVSGGNLAADDAATEQQGLPKAKFVNGIDVIDVPTTNNQCGPFASYAQQQGMAGAFVWDESTDEAGGYPCFTQFAAFLSGGPAPTPTPVPPTPVPPTPTPLPPSPTPQPTGTPVPPSGSLALLQSRSVFTDEQSSTALTYTRAVTAGDLLVAGIGVGGGNTYSVQRVSDSLGNTWTRAVTGVNGDESEADVWYTVSRSSGTETVTASLAGSGFVQTILSLGEFSGPGVVASTASHASSGTVHTVSVTGIVIVGVYVDAGYNATLTSSGVVLGTTYDQTVNLQGVSALGDAFTTSSSTDAQVSAVGFNP